MIVLVFVMVMFLVMVMVFVMGMEMGMGDGRRGLKSELGRLEEWRRVDHVDPPPPLL